MQIGGGGGGWRNGGGGGGVYVEMGVELAVCDPRSPHVS